MTRSRLSRVCTLGILVAAVGSACQFDSITVPEGRERPVVHAVLNPWAQDELVLLERTLTGRVTVDDDMDYDRTNPIITAGGVPISDARVVLYTAQGDSAVAVEDLRSRGSGAGVYRIGNSAVPREDGSPTLESIRIVPGGTYRLRITTPAGDTITGETTLPLTQPVAPQESNRFFNRDTDTLRLFWDPVPLAQRYLIRIESPWGPMFLFTDDLEARLPGSLRNVFQQNLPSVFLPGFRSTVSLAAVDANYFDYFRSANDPFTGTGLINKLEGAVGVFGSVTELYSYRLVVSANLDDPFESWYEINRNSPGPTPLAIKLYIESTAGQFTFITGEHFGSSIMPAGALVGLKSGNDLSLAFLQFSSDVSQDTLALFSGNVVGDSLIGSIRFMGPQGFTEFVRYGKTSRQ
jgi:hypothetical protein